MKTIKILAISSLLFGIVYISIGSLDKTFYYENDSEGMVIKSCILLPSILAIILGIIAVILIVFIKIKGKKVGFVFTLISLLGITMGIVDIFTNHWGRSLGAKRESDLRQIGLAMRMYYDEEGEYPEIKVNNEGYLETESIGNYMDSMPENHIEYKRILGWKIIKSLPYQGFDNTSDKKQYCIYAYLTEGEYFFVSEKGPATTTVLPSGLDCW